MQTALMSQQCIKEMGFLGWQIEIVISGSGLVKQEPTLKIITFHSPSVVILYSRQETFLIVSNKIGIVLVN